MSIIDGLDMPSFYTGLLLGFTICTFALAATIHWMGRE